MANSITLLRLGLLFVLVGMAYWASPQWQLLDPPLLLLIIALDGLDVHIGTILHPSPASPKANQGWAEVAERELTKLGVALPGGKR